MTPRAQSTITEYATHWLDSVVCTTRKYATRRRYEQILRVYILPALGKKKLTEVNRGDCKNLLVDMLAAGRARATVCSVLAVLQALMTAACRDDELIPANPALGLGRRLRLVSSRRSRQQQVHALTMNELKSFLDASWRRTPRLAPLFEVYARAGLRLGEGLALKWADVSPDSLRISRTYSDRRLGSPKSGRSRTVEIGSDLFELLCEVRREAPKGPWCFPSSRTGGFWDATYLGRVCKVIGEEVNVSGIHPQTLRHTYASLLLAQGEPPEWVSRQLGHSQLDLTIVVYGRWIEATNPTGLRHFDKLLAHGTMRPRGRRHTEAPVRLISGGRVS